MKLLYFLIFQISVFTSFAQAPSWIWAKSGGGQGNDNGFSIASDAAGNSYAIGTFRDTAAFGTFTLISAGETDVYVAKYDPSGNCLWARRGGGSSGSFEEDEGNGIDVDGAGNVYATGTFYDTASFGNFILISPSSQSAMFIVKYDSNGNELWARQATGASAVTTGADIETDASGNSYVTGLLGGPNNVFGTFTLPGMGSYVAKYNTAGIVIWASELGSNFVFRATSIALDPFGETYIGGSFSGSETIGSQTYSSVSTNDFFICKYNAAGNFVWLSSAGGTSNDYCQCNSISVDGNGNPFVVGNFGSSLTVGSTTLNITAPTGCFEIFTAKYDSTGNPLWAVQSMNISTMFPYNSGNDIVTDAIGNSYITGNIHGTTVFGSDTIYVPGYSGYVVKYDPAGNTIWTTDFSGGSCVSNGISINGTGSCFVTGFSKAPLTFGTHVTPFIGAEDIFVAKLDEQLGDPVVELPGQSPIIVYQDQSADFLQINIGKNFSDNKEIHFSLFDSSGREIIKLIIESSTEQIETAGLSSGIYVWKISEDKTDQVSGKILIR